MTGIDFGAASALHSARRNAEHCGDFHGAASDAREVANKLQIQVSGFRQVVLSLAQFLFKLRDVNASVTMNEPVFDMRRLPVEVKRDFGES